MSTTAYPKAFGLRKRVILPTSVVVSQYGFLFKSPPSHFHRSWCEEATGSIIVSSEIDVERKSRMLASFPRWKTTFCHKFVGVTGRGVVRVPLVVMSLVRGSIYHCLYTSFPEDSWKCAIALLTATEHATRWQKPVYGHFDLDTPALLLGKSLWGNRLVSCWKETWFPQWT